MKPTVDGFRRLILGNPATVTSIVTKTGIGSARMIVQIPNPKLANKPIRIRVRLELNVVENWDSTKRPIDVHIIVTKVAIAIATLESS